MGYGAQWVTMFTGWNGIRWMVRKDSWYAKMLGQAIRDHEGPHNHWAKHFKE